MKSYVPLRVIMADDHAIFREGFKLLFTNQDELQLVGEAENGKELVELAARLDPDVVITDIQMPEMDGVEACRYIKERQPHIQVIALSMFNEDKLIVEMLEAGARGYLLKNTTKNELLQAARMVHEGGTYYCLATSQKLSKMIANSSFNPFRLQNKPKFTPREIEVIQLICEENSNKEIASKLDISIRTVESHREHIQEKIGAKNSIGIAIYAMKHGMVKGE
jgi:DNA-binding NarL/FixJ family response regulator